MNFKPTLWKSIVSVIFGVLYSLNLHLDFGAGLSITIPIDLQALLKFIISATLVYLIWSFIQKKK